MNLKNVMNGSIKLGWFLRNLGIKMSNMIFVEHLYQQISFIFIYDKQGIYLKTFTV